MPGKNTPLVHGLLIKFFPVVTGETGGAHETFITQLEHKGQKQKESVDQSDYILAFCPIPLRVGTDVQEAMRKIPRGKPVILVVMHHRRDVAAYLDDSSRHVTRKDVILTVDTLFWEGELLKCLDNEKALSKVKRVVGSRSQGWTKFCCGCCFGIAAVISLAFGVLKVYNSY